MQVIKPKFKATVIQRYFVEKSIELLHRQTNDSYRLRINNSKSIITELVEVCEDLKEGRLKNHEYAKLLARNLDRSPGFIERIGKVAALHDIGKVAIPNIIKLKRTLDPIELSEMRMHAIYGAQIINKMISLSEHFEPRLEMARTIALNHHQQWDGKGYPGLIDDKGRLTAIESKSFIDYANLRPLRGDEIPVEALIVSLADKYDALRNNRAYKSALSHRKACDLLTKDDRSGKTGEEIFGADIFSVFLDINGEFNDIFEEMKDIPEIKRKW